jgi:probable phosphoglycerate mutase
MLRVVRHGKTQANDSKKESVRGYTDIPLTPEGHSESKAAGDKIAKDTPKVEAIHTSDIKRSVQTAKDIQKSVQAPIKVDPTLRSLDTGSLDGKHLTKEVKGEIKDAITHPDKKIAGAKESYNGFKKRIIPSVEKLLKRKKTNVLVAHGRVASLIKAKADAGGGEPKESTLIKDPPLKNSQEMSVSPDWKVKK